MLPQAVLVLRWTCLLMSLVISFLIRQKLWMSFEKVSLSFSIAFTAGIFRNRRRAVSFVTRSHGFSFLVILPQGVLFHLFRFP